MIQMLVNEKLLLEKLSYVVESEVVKNTKLNTIKTKVSNLEK